MSFRFLGGCRPPGPRDPPSPQAEREVAGVLGGAEALPESEIQSECPRVGVGLGRGVVNVLIAFH